MSAALLERPTSSGLASLAAQLFDEIAVRSADVEGVSREMQVLRIALVERDLRALVGLSAELDRLGREVEADDLPRLKEGDQCVDSTALAAAHVEDPLSVDGAVADDLQHELD